MTKSNSWLSREPSMLLLNAYLDNELDAASVLDVEQQLAADPALRGEHERLVQLRRRLASHLAGEGVSDDMRRRIAAIADTPSGSEASDNVVPLTRRPARAFGWQHMAAAAALAAIVTGVGTFGLVRDEFEPWRYCGHRHRSPTRAPRCRAVRCRFERSPHRQAVVRQQAGAVAAGARSIECGFPARRRSH